MLCTENHVLVKNIYTWAKLFKECRNSIQAEDRPGGPTMVSIHEMVDSVNTLIWAARRITKEDISEQLGINVGTTQKIVLDDISFSKVSCRLVSPGQCKTVETISQFGCEQLPHLTYSPDLAHSDFLLFDPHLKNFCMEQSFQAMME